MTPVLDKLLAKSCSMGLAPEPQATLVGHLFATCESASAVSDATLTEQLRAFGLEVEVWESRAVRILAAAALWHDLGKANDHFLGMLSKVRKIRQGLRHETVSLLLAIHPPLRQWLRLAFNLDEEWHLFLWAVAGHHRKDWLTPPSDGTGPQLTVYSSHPDFGACLHQVALALEIEEPFPRFDDDITLSLLSSGAHGDLQRYFRTASAVFEALPDDWKKLAALLKSALIAADVAASSQVGAGTPDPAANLSRVPAQDDLETIANKRVGGNPFRPFQLEVADTPGRVLLVQAGCGTGKSVAAYLRAARQPIFRNRRLFFCYPTTGTATEGYRDYLFDSDTKEPFPGSALFHSRASIDVSLILGQHEDEDDRHARATALDLWDTPITVCTVDTVLGLLQNQRSGHYLWPAIATGAFVFDEIHAYDDALFSTLLRFLRDLPGLPILLMTASLPAQRLEAIHHVLSRNSETLTIIPGPADIETIPRYRPALGEPDYSLLTLSVSNTVKRCMRQAEILKSGGYAPLVYHSRFKYRDRVQRHKELVDAFKSGSSAVACTTQVCEMSLDLSAQVLVTDLAPIPALIQRLGRLNRHRPDPQNPFPFHVLECPGSLPYGEDELRLAREWLQALGTGVPLSQSDLVTAWERLAGAPGVISDHACQWLDSGPLTIPASLREGSPNITVLMEEDLAEASRHPQSLPELLLPMPALRDALSWPRHRFHPVAPTGSILYDSLLGAAWHQ